MPADERPDPRQRPADPHQRDVVNAILRSLARCAGRYDALRAALERGALAPEALRELLNGVRYLEEERDAAKRRARRGGW